MDRNTVIGFVLLAVLLFLYLFLSTKSSQDLQMEKKRQQDSLALVKRTSDSLALVNDTTSKAIAPTDTVGLNKANVGTEQVSVIENGVLKISFTNKGGQIKAVELKNYTSASGKPVVLSGTPYDKISYSINTSANQAAQISELFFLPATIARNADNSSTVSFRLTGAAGEEIIHQYTIRPNDYLVDWNIQMKGADRLLSQGNFNLVWQAQPIGQEKDVRYERQQTNICFYEDADFDYIMSRTEKKFEKPVQ